MPPTIPPKPGPTPPTPEDCTRCSGTGVIITKNKAVTCPACNGTGKK
jgi:DnaJ-class molecular chaperone